MNVNDSVNPTRIDVAIIGGGPAGLIAADILSAGGRKVFLFDQMPSFGRKFLLAGRGGLNITHSENFRIFKSRYREATAVLSPLLDDFDPDQLRQWCHGLGQPTFIGTSRRVFPEGFKTSPLLRVLLSRLGKQGVTFKPRHKWLGWDAAQNLNFADDAGRKLTYTASATLLALGGASWPRMGSDGNWVNFLANAGIAISPLQPANCGFNVEWSEIFRSRFNGQPLKRVSFRVGETMVRGEAMITTTGIEGGGIYAISAELRKALANSAGTSLFIDLKPDSDEASLAKRLARTKASASLGNWLRKSLGLPPVAIGLLREVSGGDLRREPAQLARLVKNLPIHVTSPQGIDRAISTAGGVCFSELNENLMLHSIPGTYIAGEMLDWEAPTGGYLLQASFSTGMRAAKAILASSPSGN